MFRRLRQRRSWWLAIAAGMVAVPSLLGAVAAAPMESDMMLPEPELNPLASPPPDPADIAAAQRKAQAERIVDLVPEKYRELVLDTAERHQLDPRLIAAIITVETFWDEHAVGAHKELGLMQILPATGIFLAARAGLSEYDLADPETSLHLGSLYISALIEQYGSVERALAAYNGGPRAADSWETNGYVRKVMAYFVQPEPQLESPPDTIEFESAA
jgi:soluble lytic murein transglycosylase-like protein